MKLTRTNDTPWIETLARGNYSQRRKPLGGERIACGLWELAPGKKSFPLHSHHLTEEAMYVISGRAKVRTPEGLTDLGPGDFVSFPPGGPAHQLINDSAEPLVYFAVGANFTGADIVEYPDSGKIACRMGDPPGGKRHVFRLKDSADYFADDPDAG